MKRSEAAKKIQDYLMYEKIDENFGYQVLKAVESIGMLPPMLPIPEQYKFEAEHEWEPEDEPNKEG